MAAGRRDEVVSELRGLVGEYFALEAADDELSCPLAVPLYGAEEVSGALDALLDQQVTMGRRVRAFEAEFASFMGSATR